MGNDLYYFYESDFSKGNLVDFGNSLPSHIRVKFADSMGGVTILDRDSTNVVQGYRGPKNNGSSGDSEYLGPSNGLQEVKFWFGVSKHLNWVPIAGWIVYAAGRAAGDTAWHSLYFDSNTGECLSHDKNKAASRLNDIGNDHYQATRYEQALEYYQHAYLNNSGNSHNDAVYKANRANTLIQLGRYEDSIAEADSALRLDGNYNCAKDIKATALNKQGCALDQEGNTEANQATKQRKYEAARLKFEEAERVTTDQSSKTTYRNNQGLMLSKIGDILHNDGDYTGAIQKYDAAIALQNNKAYHANKASSLIELGSYEDAIAEADRALGLDSGYDWAKNTKARVYNAWGLAFHKSRNYNEAIRCFTNAISLVDEATYHYNRQLAFEALQKLQISLAEQEVKRKVEKEQSSDSIHFIRMIDGSCNVPSSDAIIRNLQTHGNLNINSCVSIYAKSLLNKPMGFFIKRDCPFYTYTREDILSIIDVLEVEINADDIRIDNMLRGNPGTRASLELLSELSNDCSLFRDQQTLLTHYIQKRYELYVGLVKKQHNSSISSKSFNISDVLNEKQLLELLDNLYVIDSSSIDYINSILLNSGFLGVSENDKSHIKDLYLKYHEPKIQENNLIKVLASKTYGHIQNVLSYLFNLKTVIKTGDLDEVKSEIISECNLTDSEFDTLSSNLIYHLDDERRVFNEWVSGIEQQILGEIVE